jgi:hypothetical protein
MKPKLILCLALVLSGGLFGCSHSPNPNAAARLQNIFKEIEHQFPELGSANITSGTSSSGEVWKGEQYATAWFGSFRITIHRYASSDGAHKDVESSLRLRPATFQPKEIYKGTTLYRYQIASGKVMTAICQSGQYIIEINSSTERASQLTMKVLDAVLAELHSN